jgi:hypothetical protein
MSTSTATPFDRDLQDRQDRQYQHTLMAIADLTALVRGCYEAHKPEHGVPYAIALDTAVREVKAEAENLIALMGAS